ENAQRYLFFPLGQPRQRRATSEEARKLAEGVALRHRLSCDLFLKVPCHRSSNRGRQLHQAPDLRRREAALRCGPVEIDIEAGALDPDRSRELVDDLGV